MSQQRYNRQLPKHTSPTHQPQSRGLPKLNRQLPSSIESAASTFSSLLGMGKMSHRTAPSVNKTEFPGKTLFSLLTESKPSVSENYGSNSGYNENYNYAYQSLDSTDEVMVIEENYDGDNNFLNGRMGKGKALPPVPLPVPICDKSSMFLNYDQLNQSRYIWFNQGFNHVL